MYRRKITNPEQEYYDRTEIVKTDFRLQDRIDGIIGMTIEEIHVKSDSFIMLCSDKGNGRGMRIQLAKSDYGEYGSYLRLSAVEILYKTEQEKEEWSKKEATRREKLSTRWYEKYGTAHPQYGLPKDMRGTVKERVEKIRQKHEAEAQAQ